MYRVLCVLLVLRGARLAGACDSPRRVHITGYAEGAKSTNYYYGHLAKMYSSSVDIFCSGPQAKDLMISVDGVRQPLEAIDTTTLKLIKFKNFEIGVHVLNCTDMETMCNATLRLVVGPDAVIESKNVRQARQSLAYTFFVPIAEDYELVCCGGQADLIQITKYNPNRNLTNIKSVVLNDTCIKSIILDKSKERVVYEYYCQAGASYDIDTAVIVLIDYPPAVTQFWCIEHNLNVNCFWSATSSRIYFNLLYMDEFENSVRICEVFTNNRCEWRIFYALLRGLQVGERLHFVLHSCNYIYCNNQTFDIDRATIKKAESPQDLKPLKIGPHSAKLRWCDVYEDKAKYHKIMYKLFGTQWQEADSSSIYVNDTMGLTYYSLELKLPCREALYEVKVYARYTTTTSANDAYWSDPATISFYTEPQGDSTVAEDPICNTEAELISYKDSAAVYVVKVLARDFKKDGVKLHKKVKALRQKLAGLEEARRTEL